MSTVTEVLLIGGVVTLAVGLGVVILGLRRGRALRRFQRDLLSYEVRRVSGKRSASSPSDARQVSRRTRRGPRRLGRVAVVWIGIGLALGLLDLAAHFPPPGHNVMLQALGGTLVVVGAVLLAIAKSDSTA